MSDCTLTLDLGYGPDIEFDGQKIMVGRFVPGDNGAVWVTTQRAPVVLTSSPFATVDLEQGVYYWFRHPDNSLHVKLMPTSATANYRLLDDIDPDTLDPNPPPTPAWGRVDTIVGGANVTVDSTDPRNPIVSSTGGGGGGGAVDSVNSKTGDVVLNPDDLVDTSTAHKFVTAAEKAKLANTTGTNSGDQDLSGLVPKTTTVNGHALSGNVTVTKGDVGLGSVDNTTDATKPVSAAQATADAAIGTAAAADATSKVAAETTRATTAEGLKEDKTNKGAALGYASLDGGGKVPVSQLPTSLMEYQGTWNASTNTPTLVDGTGNTGDTWRVTVGGTRNLGSGAITFDVGDYAIYNPAGVWEKSDTTDAVASVAGKVGIVTLVKGDVGLGNVDNTADSAKPVSTAQATADTAVGTAAATDATTKANAAQSAAISASAQRASNLSDLANAGTARGNLGLGTAAVVDTGTTSGKIPTLGASGTLAIARLATGTPDGTKFVRDDGTLVTPSGGSSSALTRAEGQYVRSGSFLGFAGNGALFLGSGNGYYRPMRVGKGGTVTSVKMNITTLDTGVTYIALYAHDPATALPAGAPINNFGSVSNTSTGLKSITISQVLADETIYWVYVGPVGGSPTVASIANVSDPLLFANSSANNYIGTMLDWNSGGLTGPPTSPDARPAAAQIASFPSVIFGA